MAACEGRDIAAVGAGGMTLSWKAPVERSDGSALKPNEIAAYRIYYSKTKGQYRYADSFRIDSRGGTVDSASIPANLLGASRYYLVMTTVDADGRESVFSSPPLEIP